MLWPEEPKLVSDDLIDPCRRQRNRTFHKSYFNLIIWIQFTVKECGNAGVFVSVGKLHSCGSSNSMGCCCQATIALGMFHQDGSSDWAC